MTKTFTSLSSAAAALLLGLASAPAAFADAAMFNGFYGGLSLGSVSPDANFIPNTIDSAFGYSLFAGYNHALSNDWVVGGELSYGASGAHGISGSAVTLDFENALTISARAGYVINRTMIYGRVGYQTVDVQPSTLATSIGAEGATFGLGVEHMFTENLSGRIEFSHSILDLDSGPPGAEFDTNTVSIGIAMHF